MSNPFELLPREELAILSHDALLSYAVRANDRIASNEASLKQMTCWRDNALRAWAALRAEIEAITPTERQCREES